ncbi:MAG: succinate dehydrogenase assembly factor 2 [Alphaproteobacteria bacterium]|nr:succinate dehydrogenase assembly factor 2 [Alphaproteobacteria bacterium]
MFADPRRRRLYYRCLYTGIKETDILLGQFARAHLADLPEGELAMLERLIENGDADLYDWISGRAPVPAAWDGPLMARLRAFRVEL